MLHVQAHLEIAWAEKHIFEVPVGDVLYVDSNGRWCDGIPVSGRLRLEGQDGLNIFEPEEKLLSMQFDRVALMPEQFDVVHVDEVVDFELVLVGVLNPETIRQMHLVE